MTGIFLSNNKNIFEKANLIKIVFNKLFIWLLTILSILAFSSCATRTFRECANFAGYYDGGTKFNPSELLIGFQINQDCKASIRYNPCSGNTTLCSGESKIDGDKLIFIDQKTKEEFALTFQGDTLLFKMKGVEYLLTKGKKCCITLEGDYEGYGMMSDPTNGAVYEGYVGLYINRSCKATMSYKNFPGFGTSSESGEIVYIANNGYFFVSTQGGGQYNLDVKDDKITITGSGFGFIYTKIRNLNETKINDNSSHELQTSDENQAIEEQKNVPDNNESEILNQTESGKNFEIVCVERAYFYSNPDEGSKLKSYIIKGDKVEIVSQNAEWVKIKYVGKSVIFENWIKKSDISLADNYQTNSTKETKLEYSGTFINENNQQLIIKGTEKGKISYKVGLKSSQSCMCEEWEFGEATNTLEKPNTFVVIEGENVIRKIIIFPRQKAIIEIPSGYIENCCQTLGFFNYKND